MIEPPVAHDKETVLDILTALQQLTELLRVIGSTPSAVISRHLNGENAWNAHPLLLSADGRLASPACSVGELVKPLFGRVTVADVAAARAAVEAIVAKHSAAFTHGDRQHCSQLLQEFNQVAGFSGDKHYLVLSGPQQGFYKLGAQLSAKSEGETVAKSEVPRAPPAALFAEAWAGFESTPCELGEKVKTEDITLGMLMSWSPVLKYSCYVPSQLPDLDGIPGVPAAYTRQLFSAAASSVSADAAFTERKIFEVPVVAAVAHAALGMCRELRKAAPLRDMESAAALSNSSGYVIRQQDVSQRCSQLLISAGLTLPKASAASQLGSDRRRQNTSLGPVTDEQHEVVDLVGDAEGLLPVDVSSPAAQAAAGFSVPAAVATRGSCAAAAAASGSGDGVVDENLRLVQQAKQLYAPFAAFTQTNSMQLLFQTAFHKNVSSLQQALDSKESVLIKQVNKAAKAAAKKAAKAAAAAAAAKGSAKPRQQKSAASGGRKRNARQHKAAASESDDASGSNKRKARKRKAAASESDDESDSPDEKSAELFKEYLQFKKMMEQEKKAKNKRKKQKVEASSGDVGSSSDSGDGSQLQSQYQRRKGGSAAVDVGVSPRARLSSVGFSDKSGAAGQGAGNMQALAAAAAQVALNAIEDKGLSAGTSVSRVTAFSPAGAHCVTVNSKRLHRFAVFGLLTPLSQSAQDAQPNLPVAPPAAVADCILIPGIGRVSNPKFSCCADSNVHHDD